VKAVGKQIAECDALAVQIDAAVLRGLGVEAVQVEEYAVRVGLAGLCDPGIETFAAVVLGAGINANASRSRRDMRSF